MAALPIYVHVPKFYADVLGMPIAVIGFVLLTVRIVDAVQDPLLGYWSDRGFTRFGGRRFFIGAAAPLLAFGMVALFHPEWRGSAPPALWLTATLIVVYLGYSIASISYQALGAEMSGDYVERTRITAAREGLSLVGVLLAAAAPDLLARAFGERAGLPMFSLFFVPLLALCVWLVVRYAPRPPRATAVLAPGGVFAGMIEPLANGRFRALLLVFVLNGIAASIPATLVLFYIDDVLQRPDLGGAFLALYFACGALGMPVWVRLAALIGKKRAWLVGMLLSVVGFFWAFALGPGDAAAFAAVCALSGLGLGADLALPPSLLADVIDHDARGAEARAQGAYFGLWNLVTKLNLALAAGIALPLLALLGYEPGAAARSVLALGVLYALVPSALKLAAAAALWFAP
ncbi:MAG: MFS transporter, partial [Betaproteobacteria bacterium]|nr:MFS transporter [Betaproteobacteria bacterium]